MAKMRWTGFYVQPVVQSAWYEREGKKIRWNQCMTLQPSISFDDPLKAWEYARRIAAEKGVADLYCGVAPTFSDE
jgi:hypothetical protein